jgi:hypothetical protein
MSVLFHSTTFSRFTQSAGEPHFSRSAWVADRLPFSLLCTKALSDPFVREKRPTLVLQPSPRALWRLRGKKCTQKWYDAGIILFLL